MKSMFRNILYSMSIIIIIINIFLFIYNNISSSSILLPPPPPLSSPIQTSPIPQHNDPVPSPPPPPPQFDPDIPDQPSINNSSTYITLSASKILKYILKTF